jgi:glycosyltransferase involved in cell wall biosynthesis
MPPLNFDAARMTVDVIIPALDEHSNIDALFDELDALRDQVANLGAFEMRHIVFADNGSTDGSDQAAAARGAIVVREPRRGYGAACLKAIEWIGGQDRPPDAVVFLDADLSDDPAAMPDLLWPILSGRAEIAIGSRLRRADPGALNLVQRFGNQLACGMMRILGGHRYSDLGPFRAATWPTLERLNMADRTWGWTVELQMKAAMLGIPTVEVDVPYRRRREGRSKISGTVRGVITAGTRIIVTIIALRLRRRAILREGRDRGAVAPPVTMEQRSA